MYQERTSASTGATLWRHAFTCRQPADAGLRVLPDGCTDVIWTGTELLVAGPDTSAVVIPTRAGHVDVGIRMPPGVGPAAIGVPALDLRDRRVRLSDLWPVTEVRHLTELLHAAKEPAVVLEELVAERLRHAGPPDPVLAHIVDRARAGTPVADIAEQAGLSPRHLHRTCLAAFGYGAKSLSRILRMRYALSIARQGVPFAQVAAMTGYADQAHMSREFKNLAGVPLGRLVRGARTAASRRGERRPGRVPCRGSV